MSTTKQLEKMLDVDGTIYEVNAVYSDEAGKVTNPLRVTKQVGLADNDYTDIFEVPSAEPGGEPTTTDEYNGSVERRLNIVPASGGAFTGPVLFKSIDDLTVDEATKPYVAVNRYDISTLLSKLTGAPAFTWDGSDLKPLEYEVTGGTQSGTATAPGGAGASGTVYAKFSIILGSKDHLEERAKGATAPKLINSSNCPVAYLYICTDTDDLYFGGSLVQEVLKWDNTVYNKQLATHALTADTATHATSATSAASADKATNAEKLTSTTNTSQFYTYATLAKALSDLNSAITTISNTTIDDKISTHNTDATAHKYLVDCIRKILRDDAPDASNVATLDSLQVHNSKHFAGKSEEYFQKRIYIGADDKARDKMRDDLGIKSYVHGDIWIQLES